jgi:hypothetical protein
MLRAPILAGVRPSLLPAYAQLADERELIQGAELHDSA